MKISGRVLGMNVVVRFHLDLLLFWSCVTRTSGPGLADALWIISQTNRQPADYTNDGMSTVWFVFLCPSPSFYAHLRL